MPRMLDPTHEQWQSGRDVAAGSYLARLVTQDYFKSLKMPLSAEYGGAAEIGQMASTHPVLGYVRLGS